MSYDTTEKMKKEELQKKQEQGGDLQNKKQQPTQNKHIPQDQYRPEKK